MIGDFQYHTVEYTRIFLRTGAKIGSPLALVVHRRIWKNLKDHSGTGSSLVRPISLRTLEDFIGTGAPYTVQPKSMSNFEDHTCDRCAFNGNTGGFEDSLKDHSDIRYSPVVQPVPGWWASSWGTRWSPGRPYDAAYRIQGNTHNPRWWHTNTIRCLLRSK